MPKPFVLINIPKTGSTYAAEFILCADTLTATRRVPGLNALFACFPPLRQFAEWVHRRTCRSRVEKSTGKDLEKSFGNMAIGLPHHTHYHQLPPPLRTLPAMVTLRDTLVWHRSRWRYTLKNPSYPYHRKLLSHIADVLHEPDGPERDVYRRFAEEHLNNRLEISALQNVNAKGYWYLTHHIQRKVRLREELPSAPRLSPPMGFLTIRVLLSIHNDPQRVLTMPKREMEEYFESGRWRRDICPGWFLRQERLRDDLYSTMLRHLDYDKAVLDKTLRIKSTLINATLPKGTEMAKQEFLKNRAVCEEILDAERIYEKYILPLADVGR